MSRPRLLRPMAPDLATLGDQLTAAVDRDVSRRRARRQAFLNAAASLVVVIPVAVTIALGTVTVSEEQVVGAGGASATLTWTPGFDMSLRHIPEERVQTLEYLRCLDAKDCRMYVEPVPYAVDFPPRRA